MKNKIILPRTDKEGNYYLSYSQISTWKKSKRDYIRQYFLGEAFTGNKYTEFGTKVGESLENNDFSGFTKKEQEFLKTVPRYDEFEREIKLNMKGFYVKGFIDTNSLEPWHKGHKYQTVLKLADYKTGDITKKKEEYESDDYIQLEIYSAAIKQDTKKLPKDVKVYLIDRKGNAYKGEELTLGEEYVTIDKKITLKRVKEVKKIVQDTAEEISDYYKVFLKLNEL